MAQLVDGMSKTNYAPRVAGGGNTVIEFNNKQLAFCKTLQESPAANHTSATDIQGISDQHPIAIVPPSGAFKSGSIKLTVHEIWGKRSWEQLGIKISDTTATKNTKMALFKELFDKRRTFTIRRLINNNGKTATRVYEGCVLTDVSEGDTNIGLNTSTSDVVLSFNYTHYTETFKED